MDTTELAERLGEPGDEEREMQQLSQAVALVGERISQVNAESRKLADTLREMYRRLDDLDGEEGESNAR